MATPIELLEAQSAATRQVIQSLADPDMAKQAPTCPGWTVKDIVVHLTAAAEMFDQQAKGTIDGSRWLEERARRMAAIGSLSPGELRARYQEADQALVSTFKSLSAEQLQAKRTHPALGEIPVQQFLGMRISEAAIHGWDIQAALNPKATFQSPALPGVLPALVAAWPAWFIPEKIAGLTRGYRFLIGEPLNHDHTLRIAGGKASWAQDGTPGEVTMTLQAGDFLLLLAGRLSSEQLVTAGRAQVSGDVAAAKELSTLFKAYGGR
jgi:uncharacterized protein (TIGR03083 family)